MWSLKSKLMEFSCGVDATVSKTMLPVSSCLILS